MHLKQDWRYFIEVMPCVGPSFPDCCVLAIWLFPTWQPQLFPLFAVSNMPHGILDLNRLTGGERSDRVPVFKGIQLINVPRGLWLVKSNEIGGLTGETQLV